MPRCQRRGTKDERRRPEVEGDLLCTSIKTRDVCAEADRYVRRLNERSSYKDELKEKDSTTTHSQAPTQTDVQPSPAHDDRPEVAAPRACAGGAAAPLRHDKQSELRAPAGVT